MSMISRPRAMVPPQCPGDHQARWPPSLTVVSPERIVRVTFNFGECCSEMARSTTTGASMKKLINDPGDVVAQAIQGMAAAHPEIRVDHEHRIVYRADAPVAGKVGLISGGGSGHEPMHGGFVGL